MAELEAFTQKAFFLQIHWFEQMRVDGRVLCTEHTFSLDFYQKKYHFISRMFLIGETITELEVFTSKHFFSDSFNMSGSFANICALGVSNVRWQVRRWKHLIGTTTDGNWFEHATWTSYNDGLMLTSAVDSLLSDMMSWRDGTSSHWHKHKNERENTSRCLYSVFCL